MLRSLFTLTLLSILSFSGHVAAQTEISETATSVFKIDENTEYTSTLNMRSQRRFGLGTSVGGNLGTVGMQLELNIEDADGVVAGFGAGSGFSTFELLWKHAFEGDYIAPYTTLGYSRWYNSSGDPRAARDSSILNRVLSESDKRTGRFATNFVTGSLGLQYNQLSGEAAGVSVFAELILMGEVEQSVLIPNGAVGAMYYF